jgi:hypothetical protein
MSTSTSTGSATASSLTARAELFLDAVKAFESQQDVTTWFAEKGFEVTEGDLKAIADFHARMNVERPSRVRVNMILGGIKFSFAEGNTIIDAYAASHPGITVAEPPPLVAPVAGDDDVFEDAPVPEPVAAETAAPVETEKPILDYALDAIRRGWFIAPCKPRTKEPATKHGVKDATNDEAQVRAWWSENPDLNYLIATGPSGIVVRDYDKVAPFENKPATLRVQTGRAEVNGILGIQDYYIGASKTYSFRADGQRKLPGSDPNAWLHDADGNIVMETVVENGQSVTKKVANPENASVGEVRGDFAYVIGPGSVHPSGNRYQIISDVPLAQLPAEDVKAITPVVRGEAVGTEVMDKAADTLEEAMRAAGIPFESYSVGAGGEYKWYVECPWWTEHSDGGKSRLTSTSALILWADGKIIYACQHGHCDHRKWHEQDSQTNSDLYLRDLIEERTGIGLQFNKLELTPYEAAPVAPVNLEAGAPATVVPAAAEPVVAPLADGVPATWQFPPSFAATEDEEIPPYNPAIEDGYFKEVVDAVCNGTTIPRQFMHNLIRAFVGALASDFLRFEGLTCNSSRYAVNLGESGTGKRLVLERGIKDIFGIYYIKNDESRKIKVIESADSGAGLRDAFFDSPRNAPVFMVIDEAASLSNKANETKNPEIVDAIIELADATTITRVKAAKGKKAAVRSHDDARLSLYMCAQSGEMVRAAFAGRKKQGIDERLSLEHSPRIEGADLPAIPDKVKLELADKLVRLLEKMKAKGMLFMSATEDAKDYLDAYWKQQPKEVREKIRLRRNLWLDVYMRAFSRGEAVATLEDAMRVAEHFERDKVIRRVHFRGEIASKVGLYLARIQKAVKTMRTQLNRGVVVPLVAMSKRDLQNYTHAFDDNELDLFDRAFKAYANGNLWEVSIKAANGHAYWKLIPIPHEDENWPQLAAGSFREVGKV